MAPFQGRGGGGGSCNEKSDYKEKEITNGMILTGLAHSTYSKSPRYLQYPDDPAVK